MQSKIVTEGKQLASNHKLWKGQSGSIYIETNDGQRVCLVARGNSPGVGTVIDNPHSTTWEPFYGKIELWE